MANLGAAGNLSGAEMQTAKEFDALPKGWYNAHITDSAVTTENQGDPQQKTKAALTFTVLDGEFAGRKFWMNLNLVHPNPVAQKIAQDQLFTLASNCGHPSPMNIGDSEELHGRPVRVLIGFGKGEYASKNEVKGTAKLEGAATSAPAPAATAPKPPSAPTAPVAPPAPPAPPQDAAMAAAGF